MNTACGVNASAQRSATRAASWAALTDWPPQVKKFDSRETVDTIEKEQITVVGMVPTVCRMLLPEIKDDPSRCASLRRWLGL